MAGDAAAAYMKNQDGPIDLDAYAKLYDNLLMEMDDPAQPPVKADPESGQLDLKANNKLAWDYLKGRNGRSQNDQKAFELFNHGCDAGYALSCGNLGVMYAKGWGVDRNRDKAAALYKQGCDAGFDSHCGNLGFAYTEGWGVEKDVHKAVPLLEKGCAKGYTIFCDKLEKIR